MKEASKRTDSGENDMIWVMNQLISIYEVLRVNND